ncbi:hypothetical protein LINGRAHAP2_LOCUS5925 [Linum grandiflorum]
MNQINVGGVVAASLGGALISISRNSWAFGVRTLGVFVGVIGRLIFKHVLNYRCKLSDAVSMELLILWWKKFFHISQTVWRPILQFE